jgi:hypothetical protein
MDDYVVIKKVLDNPYSVRPLHDKLTTVENKRPSPPLPNLIAVHKTKSNTQNIITHLSIKTLTGWQDVKQRTLLLVLFSFF